MKKTVILSVISVIVLVAILAVYWIGGVIMGNSSKSDPKLGESVDYVIVLGCRLDGEKPGVCLNERVNVATEYLKKNTTSLAVGSGAQGDDEVISEAEAIARALEKNGILSKRIIKEDNSYSTFENLVNTKKILDEKEKGKEYTVAIVTSDFHIYRSKYLAEKIGFKEPVMLPAKTPTTLFYQNIAREICSVILAWCNYWKI